MLRKHPDTFRWILPGRRSRSAWLFVNGGDVLRIVDEHRLCRDRPALVELDGPAVWITNDNRRARCLVGRFARSMALQQLDYLGDRVDFESDPSIAWPAAFDLSGARIELQYDAAQLSGVVDRARAVLLPRERQPDAPVEVDDGTKVWRPQNDEREAGAFHRRSLGVTLYLVGRVWVVTVSERPRRSPRSRRRGGPGTSAASTPVK